MELNSLRNINVRQERTMIKHIEKELRNVLTVQQGSTARVKGMTIQQMTVQLVFIVSIELTTALLMMVSQALFAPKVIIVHEEQMLPSRVKKVPMDQLNSLALKQNVRDVNQENFVQKTGLMKPLETAQQVSSVDVMLQSMNQLTVSLVTFAGLDITVPAAQPFQSLVPQEHL